MSCDAVARVDLSQVTGSPAAITTAAPATAQPGGYPVCDVTGTIAPQIQFQIQLPTTTYRQRYLQTGCGGLCGTLAINAQQAVGCAPLTDGAFVTASNNQGHVGGNGLFGTDPQLRADFAYRADHALAVVAKTLIAKVYGSAPRWSYFDGCSQGGHEGLAEAQRYPDDFDGIVAGAPANITTELNSFYQPWLATIEFDAAGAPILSADKLAPLHAGVMSQCDGLDGLVDGQIDDPRACTPDLTRLQCPAGGGGADCLTAAQVDVVGKIYSGPVDERGNRLYLGGETPGSELAWLGWIVPAQPGAITTSQSIGGPWLEYLAFQDNPPQSSTVADARFDRRTFETVEELAGLYNATNPDLSAYRDSGGKLLMYHGWADQAISPYGTPAYYQAVQDQMGGLAATQQFARLYMLPGMLHCRGGQAPNTFDALTPVLAWVEQGVAPGAIVATDPTTARTRPVYPYPQVARYDGSGSTEDAANFTAAEPPVRYDDHVDWLGDFRVGGELWYDGSRLTRNRPAGQ
jgi:feruloyl esterase